MKRQDKWFLPSNVSHKEVLLPESGDTFHETEVKLSSKLSHPNISKLLGYCSEDMNLFLVYEFIYKGSLETYILNKGFEETLSWSMRVKIMLGTAKGIAYLHSSENQIIFRDLKTSNILLDQVIGTYGYAAPEYVATGVLVVSGYLNGKNDIYAFGVVLLETLTGLRVFDNNRPDNKQDLVQWMKPMLSQKKKLMTIVDPSLGNDYPPEAICRWAKLILKCTQTEPKDRPCIEQVLQRLERISCIKTKLFHERGRDASVHIL
ncbi:hypothetical protein M8C21_030706 [Ambrosia artemisiifolia]|uniref:Protein kinase domain-containing protein n=1 Tax=Ambrosia artemisiifolia TaxID=4212 RepID=A0AAD5GVX8_AMBAR|nr:hypothetical protein M8C21_030706 [Ambrosia artemisiifolia]